MKVKYLKYKQALAACLGHQHLIGLPFEKDNDAAGKVMHVLIAPYSRILQWYYLSNVLAGQDPNKAITICRDGKYDVLLISSEYKPGEESIPPKNLHSYLAEFGVAARPVTAQVSD